MQQIYKEFVAFTTKLVDISSLVASFPPQRNNLDFGWFFCQKPARLHSRKMNLQWTMWNNMKSLMTSAPPPPPHPQTKKKCWKPRIYNNNSPRNVKLCFPASFRPPIREKFLKDDICNKFSGKNDEFIVNIFATSGNYLVKFGVS